jgi:hypothetical protein
MKVLSVMALSLLATGCKESRIRAYTVPAERPARLAAAPARPTPSGDVAEAPSWTLPEGWQEVPGTGMRFATLIVEPGEKPLEIRVTPLALMARDPLGNVNRWREQIGLPHVTEAELGSVVKTIDVEGRQVDLVNLTGEAAGEGAPQGILAAIYPGDSQVWFFLMMDDADRVSRQAGAFESFVRGIRLEGGADHVHVEPAMMDPEGLPAGAVAGPGAGSETMTWTLPEGWVTDTTPNPMRVATFRLAGSEAEVTITRFPGDVGGLLANINRWRNQLSIEPISDPAQQPSEHVHVAGHEAHLYDIAPAGDAPTSERMLVVFLPRPDMSWFIKMTGSRAVLERERKAFTDFVQTIGLRSDAP